MMAIFAACCFLPFKAQAQLQQAESWAADASVTYGVGANIQYGTFGGVPEHLDVWRNSVNNQPKPTLIYIHGGGWVFGDKNGADPLFLPFLVHGWNVVNVEYRMAGTHEAPAAVEDVRCALRWVYRNAKNYNIDTTQLVAMGHSAGGHLALMEGLLPAGSPMENACPADASEPPLRVAAVVNWYGITDVNDLLQGPNRRTYAVAWLGAQPNRDEVAKAVSPLTYVRPGVPPVFTVQGDHDPTVPYTHSLRLNEALERAKVPHELFTIPGGVHGSFTPQQTEQAYQKIWSFLGAQHLTVWATGAPAGQP